MTAKKTVNTRHNCGVYEIAEIRVYYTEPAHQISYLLQIVLLVVVFSRIKLGKGGDFCQDCPSQLSLLMLPGCHGQPALLIIMIKHD